MNETLKRTLSGTLYVLIMWIGTSYSQTSFRILFMLIFVVCLYEMWKLRKNKTKFIALLYITIPFILIHTLDNNSVNNSFDPTIILLIYILTWTFDTFGYIFGVKFGKHKIMPNISPKKSWEGFIGGYVSTIIAAFSFNFFFMTIDLLQVIIISLFLPFTATIGDFIESYYKRKAGVKDSGNFIPGHGGMLDRIDAFTITIPILYIYINLIR